MHELSIAQALVEQVEAIATREGAAGVGTVRVAVGGLSGVNADALELAFPVAAERTVAEGALLAIEKVPAILTCRACNRVSHPDLVFMVCEQCGSSNVELSGGRELLLTAVELRVEA